LQFALGFGLRDVEFDGLRRRAVRLSEELEEDRV
jgi:hypothetical protein